MDRARWLRANNYGACRAATRGARAPFRLQARRSRALLRHADPACRRCGAGPQLADRLQHRRQIDDVLPAGRAVADQPIGVRDDYTSLAWLAGSVALDRMNQSGERASRCSIDTRARGRSLQVQTKGDYWAGRAALAAGQFQDAQRLFPARRGLSRTCSTASSRWSGSAARFPPPPAALPQYVTTPAAAHGVQQPPAGPGDPAARPAGPIDRAGVVRPGARRIARQRCRPQSRGGARRSRSAGRTCRSGSRAWRG